MSDDCCSLLFCCCFCFSICGHSNDCCLTLPLNCCNGPRRYTNNRELEDSILNQPNPNGMGVQPIDVPPVAEKPMSIQRERQRQSRQLEGSSTGAVKKEENLPRHSTQPISQDVARNARENGDGGHDSNHERKPSEGRGVGSELPAVLRPGVLNPMKHGEQEQLNISEGRTT
ncbi:hypothetical protein L218DRAFT_964538 [Marasmius fiardii PR-910]|nr:hypothetical protein L218DRAFT_964538 [Marasmius fiardii PR-910]